MKNNQRVIKVKHILDDNSIGILLSTGTDIKGNEIALVDWVVGENEFSPKRHMIEELVEVQDV